MKLPLDLRTVLAFLAEPSVGLTRVELSELMGLDRRSVSLRVSLFLEVGLIDEDVPATGPARLQLGTGARTVHPDLEAREDERRAKSQATSLVGRRASLS